MEFDYWSFVACCRCQVPFEGSRNEIPFWLTECGHVVCNNHLHPDRSCAHCGARDIQLVPLQRQMEKPMSEWFRAIPQSLDSIASAAKFQQETMAAQILYYKAKHQKDRGMIDRLKGENAELQKMNQSLQFQLQQPTGGFQSSDTMNQNGKRRMLEQDRYSNGRPATHSSPRSIITPLGPNRLTLPPGQQPPHLSSSRSDHGNQDQYGQHDNSGNSGSPAQQRPGSSKFAEQYAYVPPSTQQFHPQSLSHAQNAPRQFQRAKPTQEQLQNSQRTMMPPPIQPSVNSSRFKPAPGRIAPNTGGNSNSNPIRRPSLLPAQMTAVSQTPFSNRRSASTSNNLNVALGRSSQRFVPSTPSGSNRFLPPGNHAGQGQLSRMNDASGAGGQRRPFVPGSFG